MTRRTKWIVSGVIAVVLAAAIGLVGLLNKEDGGVSAPPGAAMRAGDRAPVADPYTPAIDAATFTSVVDNPFFPLRPGMT